MMEIPSEIIAVLSSLGVIQALFLAIYLLQLKSRTRIRNVMLAFMLLGVSIRVGKSVLNYYLELEPWHRNWGLAGFLTVGPWLYFYGKSLLSKEWQLGLVQLLHFIPALVFLVFSSFIPNQTEDVPSYIAYSLVLFQLLMYIISSNRLFKMANISLQLYNWYKSIVFGVAILWLFYLLIFIRLIPAYIGGAILHSFLIYAFSYLMLKLHKFSPEKYMNSQLGESEVKLILSRLDFWMKKERPFLQPDLTLEQVAKKLDVNPRTLSQVLNERLGQNFSTYINHFRISAAKEMLTHHRMAEEKIATIAYETGFTNLTSFNENFKSITDLTPSQFRKQFLIKDS